MSLPDAIIVGAQRCGTTRFFNRLTEHGGISMPLRKEIHFYDLRYHRGLKYYNTMFVPKGGRVAVEASPYYIYHPLVAQRIFESQPSVKIIALLRNPIDRAFSNYHHEVRRNQEPFSFEEAIEKEDNRIAGEEERIIQNPLYYSVRHNQYSYLRRGDYAFQLQRYYSLFPRKNICIIKSEDFYRNEVNVLNDILKNFLGLEKMNYKSLLPPKKKYDSVVSKETRNRLIEYYKPKVLKLKELTGISWEEYE